MESDSSLLKHSHGVGLLTSYTKIWRSDKLQSPSTYKNSNVSQSPSTDIEQQARVKPHESVLQESWLNTSYSTFTAAAAVTLSWFTCTFHASAVLSHTSMRALKGESACIVGVVVQNGSAPDVDRLPRGASKRVNIREGGVWSFSENNA